MPGISVNDVLECITECIIKNEDTELFVFFFFCRTAYLCKLLFGTIVQVVLELVLWFLISPSLFHRQE